MQSAVGAMRGVGVVVALAALTVGVSSAAAADQHYYWKWSDGSSSSSRTLTQEAFGLPSNLPSIVVTASPSTPSRTVSLQFRRHDRWVTEASTRTDSTGVATIEVDPLCAGRWCARSFDYRLVVDGQHATLSVTYSAR